MGIHVVRVECDGLPEKVDGRVQLAFVSKGNAQIEEGYNVLRVKLKGLAEARDGRIVILLAITKCSAQAPVRHWRASGRVQ